MLGGERFSAFTAPTGILICAATIINSARRGAFYCYVKERAQKIVTRWTKQLRQRKSTKD